MLHLNSVWPCQKVTGLLLIFFYICVATSPPSTVIVIAPGNTTVSEGDSVFLTCVSYGVPYSTITWTKEGTELVNDTKISIHSEAVIEHGLSFTQSILDICSITELSDGGMYECTAENGASTDSVSFTLSVLPHGGELDWNGVDMASSGFQRGLSSTIKIDICRSCHSASLLALKSGDVYTTIIKRRFT